jgi:hypothetical protein
LSAIVDADSDHVVPFVEYVKYDASAPVLPTAANSASSGDQATPNILLPDDVDAEAFTVSIHVDAVADMVEVVPIVASVGLVMLLVRVAELTSLIFFVVPAAVTAAEYVNKACAMLAPVLPSLPVEVFRKTMFESE